MDYAALGLPTVASDIGVYDGVVRDGLNGLLLPNTDMGWFAGLARLIRDPSQRALMAKQASFLQNPSAAVNFLGG